MNEAKSKIIDRIADRVDLAIDFLTLGQYGLESCEGRGHGRHGEPGTGPGTRTSARWAGCEGGEEICFGGFPRREALPLPARKRGCETPSRGRNANPA